MTSESDLQLARDLGKIEGDVKAMERELKDFKNSVNSQLVDMQKKVDQMHAIMLRADGGIKTMIMIGSAGATIGAAISWALTTWSKLRGNS